MNRRSRGRTKVEWKTRVSSASEREMPEARLVDASNDGALIVLDEPAGLAVDQRVAISVELESETFILVGDVVRVDRGSDFRTYVAVVFQAANDGELDRWAARLESDDLAPGRVPSSS